MPGRKEEKIDEMLDRLKVEARVKGIEPVKKTSGLEASASRAATNRPHEK